MTIPRKRFKGTGPTRSVLALLCTLALAPGDALAYALAGQQESTQPSSAPADASRIPSDQLDSLVAPIALYPDPLLAQTLAASTYPLEVLQLHQWLAKNAGLKDEALADAVSKQPWDASVQAMAALPDVVKRLADDVQWTTDLGNAFLAQQGDVMDAVQRMRRKAEDKGTLTSTSQQTVETRVVESKEVIVIEQSDPQVVYVPSYNPTVVYGAPVYPYPPIYYPPPGYYAAGAAISFGVGVAMGAAWGGGWGWGAGWGRNDIDINTNNNFVRNSNINSNRTGNVSNKWQHRSEHRGGTPYRDRATAERFGGTARGDSLANRQAGARQQVSRQGGNARSGAVGTSGLANRAGGGDLGSRAASGGLSSRSGSGNLSSRAAGSGAGGANLSSRAASGDLGSRAGSADRMGSRDFSRSGGGNTTAFGGGSRSFDGASARSSSSRGASSMRSSGGSRSGGFSGGSRGGGGGRRGGGGGRR